MISYDFRTELLYNNIFVQCFRVGSMKQNTSINPLQPELFFDAFRRFMRDSVRLAPIVYRLIYRRNAYRKFFQDCSFLFEIEILAN